MRNSEVTKNKILSASSVLFNVQGYKATSLSDITQATGLTKGAIYRHFTDKDALEESAYAFMSKQIQEKFTEMIRQKHTAPEKLMAICDFFLQYIDEPLFVGGCPILNAGVETDDTKPGLNAKVVQLLDALQQALEHIVLKGIKYGQIKTETDPVQFSTVFIASLEGGILLSKLRKRNSDMDLIVKHLQENIARISN